MELDFNKIIRLKKIRIEKSELSEEERVLTTPVLTDKGRCRVSLSELWRFQRRYRVSLH
jgi:hypothetical protein